jgi:hypothetical protein
VSPPGALSTVAPLLVKVRFAADRHSRASTLPHWCAA